MKIECILLWIIESEKLLKDSDIPKLKLHWRGSSNDHIHDIKGWRLLHSKTTKVWIERAVEFGGLNQTT